MRPSTAALAFALAIAAVPAHACLWDSDTIAEERSKFPTAMELLAGKYNRHSPAFYEWRIQDRRKKLAKDPNNFALLDDLGVALLKTGKIKEAVEVGEREVALDPKRYESQSNLGTYYIFAGDLDKSAEHIKAALAINPDAHFGREKYQLYLVEYLRAAKRIKGNGNLPLRMGWPEYESDGYKALSPNDQQLSGELEGMGYLHFIAQEDPAKALHGVFGMMRFANDELPILNEVAGDLLNRRASNQIAGRAYLKAAHFAPEEAKKTYRNMAGSAVRMQTNLKLDDLESDFEGELAQGKAWQAQIAADEARWIAEGKDPEAEYDKKYRADNEPTVSLSWFSVPRQFFRGWFTGLNAPIGWGVSGIALAIGLYIWSWRRRRKKAKEAQARGEPLPPPRHRSFWLSRR